MKEYKLIKEYPGSPKLGTKIRKCSTYAANWMFKRDCNLFPVTSVTPKEYPEYWKEIVEKNYQILSTISTKYNSIYGEGELKHVFDESYTHRNNAAPKSPWNIHSVKRLSDGEIFTVGDRVSIISDNKNIHYIIDRLKITDNGIYINASSDCNKKRFGQDLTSIQHVKKPLFTTEDGVDIFEGDVCWACTKELNDLGVVNWENKHPYLHAIYFSTKKTAEEYILMNKPCLSINDVIKLRCPRDSRVSEYSLYFKVKEKLCI